jgi:UDP-2,4-diacetamido-2,4,6-trideoxy-beta-L-altropyranose hydrolase
MADWFVIRADANKEIGIGHVMRCLALAEWLYAKNVSPLLLTKFSNELIVLKIKQFKGKVTYLPDSLSQAGDSYLHSKWLNGSEDDDATLCSAVIEQEIKIKGKSPLFILIDHYALAAPWEKKLAQYANILVVDDLSDRPHECSWLVDQTFGKTEADYVSLVPQKTQLLIGPQYALIRKEFIDATVSLQRAFPKKKIKVLLTLGGVDKNNDTSKLLSLFDYYKSINNKIVITVITSNSNPNLADLKATISHMNNTSLLVDANNMAELMAEHDICIGAAGSTSWERCVMSLPTLSIVLAENQQTISKNLAEVGAIIDLGLVEDITKEVFFEGVNSLINNKDLYDTISNKSKTLCDGFGCQRIIERVIN